MFVSYSQMLLDLIVDTGAPIYIVANQQGRFEEAVDTDFKVKNMTIFPAIETTCAAVKAMADYADYLDKQTCRNPV